MTSSLYKQRFREFLERLRIGAPATYFRNKEIIDRETKDL
jgi:hypothetical protein